MKKVKLLSIFITFEVLFYMTLLCAVFDSPKAAAIDQTNGINQMPIGLKF